MTATAEILPEIAITGLGLVSSLGRDVETSCAAARAGLSRAAPLDTFAVYDEEAWADLPVIGHAVPGLADGFEGLGKLIRLGAAGLVDACRYSGLAGSSDDVRTGLMLTVSNHYLKQRYVDSLAGKVGPEETARARKSIADEQALVGKGINAQITRLAGLHIPAGRQAIVFGDKAGFATLVREASRALNSGRLDVCIVGGIDSYNEPDVIRAAVALDLIKTPTSPFGFQPGEAASFVVLESLEHARQRNARIEGLVSAPGVARDSGHRLSDQPPLGLGLAEAIAATLDQREDRGGNLSLILADLNGDPHPANDWGHAQVKLRSGHSALATCTEWHPAAAFGEIGAAAGAAAVCCAARGFSRGFSADHVLIWLASLDGERGSLYLRPA